MSRVVLLQASSAMASAVLTLIAIPRAANGAAVPPPIQQPIFNNPATLLAKPSNGVVLGGLHVVFVKTTLRDVIKSMNSGRIDSQGEAGEAILWICYTLVAPKGNERVWVIASAEMGGPDHEVTEIDAKLIHAMAPTPDCPAPLNTSARTTMDNGLWLGDATETIHRRLGQPSNTLGDWEEFEYQGKAPGRGLCAPEGLDVVNWFAAKLGSGSVSEIHAGQTSSC